MIRSMTAFTRISSLAKQGGWVVELRTVNHRYFEFSLRCPTHLSVLENQIRELFRTHIKRGKVMVNISQDLGTENGKEVRFNESAVKLYLASIEKAKKKFKLRGEVEVAELMKLPGVFSVQEEKQKPEKSWPSLKLALEKAIKSLIRGKSEEGKKLCKDIRERLQKISKATGRIEKNVAGRVELYFEKIQKRVNELLADGGKDPDRIHREVAFLAERSDITEEIVRMKSHLDLYEKRLKAEGEIGRELDFLCQEMNREINTMGSKSGLFDVSTDVVFVKGELEKIREQVQNIE